MDLLESCQKARKDYYEPALKHLRRIKLPVKKRVSRWTDGFKNESGLVISDAPECKWQDKFEKPNDWSFWFS